MAHPLPRLWRKAPPPDGGALRRVYRTEDGAAGSGAFARAPASHLHLPHWRDVLVWE